VKGPAFIALHELFDKVNADIEDYVRRDFTGTVSGRQMSGTFRDEKGQSGNWTAAKK